MPPPVVVTAAPARIVKWAVDLRLTGAGPAENSVWKFVVALAHADSSRFVA
jgi:hypothetical protein